MFAEDEQDDFRTSESCDLDTWSPLVRTVDARFAQLLGLPPAHAETLQGQRYGPTQKYGAHHDFFSEKSTYWKKISAVGGQRTWTAMAYLNVPEAGGGTRFTQLGIEVQPRAGMVVVWNNMAADGSPNNDTLHEGRPVEAGAKYVITKWFREARLGLSPLSCAAITAPAPRRPPSSALRSRPRRSAPDRRSPRWACLLRRAGGRG